VTDVGREALELEGLETSPAEEAGVRGGKLAKAFDEVFGHTCRHGVLFGSRNLAGSVLADLLVRSPMRLLAFLRLERMLVEIQCEGRLDRIRTQYCVVS
jgi:hypothetical protein